MTPATLSDPVGVLKGFASLRRLAGTYPAGHPMITRKVQELDETIQRYLERSPTLRVEVIHGKVFLDGASFDSDEPGNALVIHDLSELGVDSLHIHAGVEPEELLRVAEFLWQFKEGPVSSPIADQLLKRGVRHVSIGSLVPLDTRWRAEQWPDAPVGPLDPAYAESLRRTQDTFDAVASGEPLKPVTIRDLVKLLVHEVARSNAALAQILAVKQYENLTYCHSVNVAILSLLIARQLALDEATTGAVVEVALLHDIGKTRVPLGVLKKPGTLNKRERKLMEAHTVLGAEILAQVDGLHPLAPTVALEHHRAVVGTGYPDLGDGVVPHPLSQIVSVADVYEAITGARSYQAPMLPEHACLVLARLAGAKLNTAIVKAFVNAVTFFPLGSMVRTNHGEVGVVVRTNRADPLHPVITVTGADLSPSSGEIDTSARTATGEYERHIVETLMPPAHQQEGAAAQQ